MYRHFLNISIMLCCLVSTCAFLHGGGCSTSVALQKAFSLRCRWHCCTCKKEQVTKGARRKSLHDAVQPSNKIGSVEISGKNITATRRDRFHWNFVGTYIGPIFSKLIEDEDVINITTKALSGVLWGAIVLGMLGSVGFDTKPLLSIFGVAGLTLSLSLKDLFSDLYSGVFVMFTRPFKRGDMVTIAGYTGKVVSMDMRYVTIFNSADGSSMLVPVSMVYKNAIKVAAEDSKYLT